MKRPEPAAGNGLRVGVPPPDRQEPLAWRVPALASAFSHSLCEKAGLGQISGAARFASQPKIARLLAQHGELRLLGSYPRRY